MNEYWRVCAEEAIESAGLDATREQTEVVASCMESAHEMYGEANGHHFIENPLRGELKETQKKLELERRKVSCPECGGVGRITTHGPLHSANTECWKCRGEGKYVQ